MVTTRGKSDFATLQKLKSKEWFEKFGRNDIEWISIEIKKGSDGRPNAIPIKDPTTIIGDLQFDAKLLSAYVQLGIAQTGDGFFYTLPEYSIKANDQILVDGITWRLVSQVEAEQTNGVTIYQGWVCRRG